MNTQQIFKDLVGKHYTLEQLEQVVNGQPEILEGQ